MLPPRLLLSLIPRPPPTSPLFPYTTLFRSPLNSQLESGQTIDIVTARHARPNAAWLHFLKTAKARNGVRNYLKNQREDKAEQLRSEEHTSELQSRFDLVCRLLLEKQNITDS